MNNKIVLTFHVLRSIAIAALTCIAGAGCGTPREKPTFSRGWVGGQVVRVWNFPKALIPRPKSAILVRDLATNTPAALAGLREGDLILALDGEPVGKLLDYRRRIDSLTPGTSLRVTTWRDGAITEHTVVAGRETYRQAGSISVIVPCVAEGWSLWPRGDYPGVSLVALGYRLESAGRVERGSVHNQYDLKCHSKAAPYSEDYKIWLGILQFSKGKNIAGQEVVAAAK